MDIEKLPISGTLSLKCIVVGVVLQCIPPPPLKEYSKKLIAQTEKFERNLTNYIKHKEGAIENVVQA